MDAPSFRRTRTTFRPFQLQMLEQAFTKTQYPDAVVRQQLATYMQLPESKIQIWFKNRRSKQRRKCNSSRVTARHTSDSSSKFSQLCDKNYPPQKHSRAKHPKAEHTRSPTPKPSSSAANQCLTPLYTPSPSPPRPSPRDDTRQPSLSCQQIDPRLYSVGLRRIAQVQSYDPISPQYAVAAATPKLYEPAQGWLAGPKELYGFSCLA